MESEKWWNLERSFLDSTGADKSDDHCNDVDSQLELEEFSYRIVHIPSPHHRFDYWCEIVICQNYVRRLFRYVSSCDTLNTQRARIHLFLNIAVQMFSFLKLWQFQKLRIPIWTLFKFLTIAKPTSAFFRAGASFVPSPVTATTSLQRKLPESHKK